VHAGSARARGYNAGLLRGRSTVCCAGDAAAPAPATARAAPDRSQAFLGDLVAGVSVAFVCIPQASGSGPVMLPNAPFLRLTHSSVTQSLAYASLAGLSPTQGLHSNAVSPFAAAPTASSRYLQSGCVALSSLLTGAALTGCGLAPGTALFASAASLLALVVGCVRVAMGLLKGGRLLALLPPTVLDGFVLGAVWLVFATQVPVILGAAPPPGMHFLGAAGWLLVRPQLWQPGCLLTALLTVATLIGGKRLHPLFPGAVVATLAGCAASSAGLPVGSTIGAIQAGLPSLMDPRNLPWHLLPQLASAGAAIAIAGIAEAVAISTRFAKEDGDAWSSDRELVSQGACNLLVAAFGGFPVAGSLSRTSLARTAGATSQMANAITGATVLIFLPLGAALLGTLPRAVLGGLVATAVMPLLKPSASLLITSKQALRAKGTAWPLRDLTLGWVTCVATLAASPRLELGLEAGLALAVILACVQALDHALMESLRAAAVSDKAIFMDAAY